MSREEYCISVECVRSVVWCENEVGVLSAFNSIRASRYGLCSEGDALCIVSNKRRTQPITNTIKRKASK